VSAEFQTSRSEARHWRTKHTVPLLDSYLYNLPSSAKKKMFAISQALKGQKISNNRTLRNAVYWEQWRCAEVFDFVLSFRSLRNFAKSKYLVCLVCVSVGPFFDMEQLGS